LKSTLIKSCKFEKGEIQLNGYLLVRANTKSEFIVESSANQVSRSFSGRDISGSDRESDKDRLCFFGKRENRFQL